MLLSVLIVVRVLLNTGVNMGYSVGFKNVGGTGFDLGFGSGEDTDYGRQDEIFMQNVRSQQEFAKHGIQWRVEDAKAAGVHPVWALSGGGAAFSPVAAVGGQGKSSRFDIQGQDVSRAAQSTMSPEQRLLFEIELETKKLQRSIAEKELANMGGTRGGNQSQVGPGLPSTSIPGDMFAGDWAKTTPAERISHDLEDVSTTASAPSPAWEKFTINKAGDTIWLPSGGKGTATEALESISESPLMLYGVIKENLERDPELIYKLRHLWPGGEMAVDVARWLEQKMQWAINKKKAQRAADEMARKQLYENRRRYYPYNR